MAASSLKFKSIYKSITKLPDTKLPELVVLTGRNGSGKTHLLEAINSGFVCSSLVNNTNTDVLLFDWNNIVPNDTGVFNPGAHQTKKSNWFNKIRSEQDKVLPALRQSVSGIGLPPEHYSSFRKILAIDESVLCQYIESKQDRERAAEKLQKAIKTHGKTVYNQVQRHIGDDDWKRVAPVVASEKPELFLQPTESQFFDEERFLWGKVDVFQQAFGRLFSTYRELIHQNDRLEKYPPREGGPRHLSETEFIAQHGEPPWDFANKIL
ncbi:AAA family ATPase, partial [Salinisphaera sp. P385]